MAPRPAAWPLLLAGLLACERGPFREPRLLGGKQVSAEVLNRGFRGYRRACASCHGDRGDGRGPAGRDLDPPPRDLTAGDFRRSSVPGALPSDEDLRRVVANGIPGTAMLPWAGVGAAEIDDICQYLKTLSPRWERERPGEPAAPGAGARPLRQPAGR